MYSFITTFNLIIFLLFTIFYFYQIVYTFVSLFTKSRKFTAKKNHKFGIIIAARNEENVIAQLIMSIHKQNYPAELVDIFVVADNCTDNTASVAEAAGATVFVRNNAELVGKGYALDDTFARLNEEYSDRAYEGYFIFDADNLLDANYIKEMNSVFDAGYKMVTSYRNSKNYDSNWISAGSSLWFLREARYLNNARMILGTSCAVSGTGFLVHESVIRENGGWKYHLLTEDIQFSVDNAIHGGMIGYCDSAKLYDEQPVLFSQSWRQRLRWAKGFYQVFTQYGGALIRGVFKDKSFSCYDMFMTVTPAMF
ncbi:MAG: glycosyltransferase family 2 protein, partial [Clostridia bacterium]